MVFAARPCHACAHTVLHCTLFFFFTDPATTEIYTLSLHDALPIWCGRSGPTTRAAGSARRLPEWWHVRMPRATARRESCDPATVSRATAPGPEATVRRRTMPAPGR